MTSLQANRRMVWAAGLIVASGAGVATAHGLYRVAAAAGVPAPIAWLYPLITDGLALVAYAATSRITPSGRRYAAAIVILAAGLSGLAQATFLTGTLADRPTGANVPTLLRFGVGAWPAIAAALTAHLLHLIGTRSVDPLGTAKPTTLFDEPSNADIQPAARTVAPAYTASSDHEVVQPQRPTTEAVQAAHTSRLDALSAEAGQGESRTTSTPARDRARTAASDHHRRHGVLPTVSELMTLAGVARGTAGTVLKELRAAKPALHVITHDTDTRTTP